MKFIKDFEIKYDLQWTYGISIAELREDLDAIEALGATHVNIEAEDNWGSPSVEITVIQRREETDEEQRSRLNSEKRFEEKAKDEELRLFQKLKAKFEGKN